MRKNINCTDITKILIDEASEHFAPLWTKNVRLFEKAMHTCAILDEFVCLCDCESLEVEVDEITMEIKITLVAACMELPRKLIQALSDITRIEIKPGSECGTVLLSIWLDCIWERR